MRRDEVDDILLILLVQICIMKTNAALGFGMTVDAVKAMIDLLNHVTASIIELNHYSDERCAELIAEAREQAARQFKRATENVREDEL